MNKVEKLQLGIQGYHALRFHSEEAYQEANIKQTAVWNPPIALFSRKYYNELKELSQQNNKIYDYCFIGSIDSSYKNRDWVIEFVKKNFTSNSIFVNTVNDPNWKLLGAFDYSHKNLGFCPRNQSNNQSKSIQYRVIKENLFYFKTMCQSKYVLCPAGDAPWSFRFYEVLMCKSVPIVESWHHTYRTKEESEIKYKYVLSTDVNKDINYSEYVRENTRIFETHHLL